jgi:hypothetical protein
MSKVQIFKDREEFEKREDKTINGVSQEFLKKQGLTLETLNLAACEGCWNAMLIRKWRIQLSHDLYSE